MDKIKRPDQQQKSQSNLDYADSPRQLSYTRLFEEFEKEEESKNSKMYSNNQSHLGVPQTNLRPLPLPTQNSSQSFIASEDGPGIKISYSYSSSKAVNPSNREAQRGQACVQSMPVRDLSSQFQPQLTPIEQRNDERGSSQMSVLHSQIIKKVVIQSPLQSQTHHFNKNPQNRESGHMPLLFQPQEQKDNVGRLVEDSIEYDEEEDLELQQISQRFTIPIIDGTEQQQNNHNQHLAILSSLTTQSKNRYKREREREKQESREQPEKRVAQPQDEKTAQMGELLKQIEHLQFLRAKYPQLRNEKKLNARLLFLKQVQQYRTEIQPTYPQLAHLKPSPYSKKQKQETQPQVSQSVAKEKKQLKFSHLSQKEHSYRAFTELAQKRSNKMSQKKSQMSELDISSLKNILEHSLWQQMREFDKWCLQKKYQFIRAALSLVINMNIEVKILFEREDQETVAVFLRNLKLIVIVTPSQFYLGEYTNINQRFIRQGYGVMLRPNFEVYEGQFVNNCKQGRGISVSASKEIYDGEFAHNVKCGNGTTKYANGDCYKGDYYNNEFHGRGLYLWRNGTFYEGEFKRGKMDGIGHWKCSNGDEYQGEYKDSLKEGRGIYTYACGKRVEGLFHKGKKMKQKEQEPKADIRLEPRSRIRTDMRISPQLFTLRNVNSCKRGKINESEHSVANKRKGRDFSENQKIRIRFN